MDDLQAFALGTLRMDPETFLWSTWRELNAMVRGYEQAHRDRWERTLMLFNVQVEPRHRLTYEKLFAKNRARLRDVFDPDEGKRRIEQNEAAEKRLKELFGEAFDGV